MLLYSDNSCLTHSLTHCVEFSHSQDDEHSAPEAEKLQGKGGGGEDFENDLEANASAFEALERDFQDVSAFSHSPHSLMHPLPQSYTNL